MQTIMKNLSNKKPGMPVTTDVRAGKTPTMRDIARIQGLSDADGAAIIKMIRSGAG